MRVCNKSMLGRFRLIYNLVSGVWTNFTDIVAQSLFQDKLEYLTLNGTILHCVSDTLVRSCPIKFVTQTRSSYISLSVRGGRELLSYRSFVLSIACDWLKVHAWY